MGNISVTLQFSTDLQTHPIIISLQEHLHVLTQI